MKVAIPASMMAARLTAPGVVDYAEVPVPVAGPGDLLIRVHSVAVAGADCRIWSGTAASGTGPAAIPGGTFSGTVVAGAADSTLGEGDRVFGMADPRRGGACAEYVLVRADAVAPAPRRLPMPASAAVAVAGLLAQQALFDERHLSVDGRALVRGAGCGPGQLAVQFARLAGARVAASARGAGLAMLRSLGVEEVLDDRTVAGMPAAKGVDFLLDCLGGTSLDASLTLVRRGGVLVSLAGLPDPEAIRRAGIRALYTRVRPSPAQLERLAALLDGGRIKPPEVRTFALSRVEDALEFALRDESGTAAVLRVSH